MTTLLKMWVHLATMLALAASSAMRLSRPSLPYASSSSSYTAVMIVPTGIGASIGGYAGDALPSAKLLASIADTLITHPNVLNGASLYWPIENALYVEGYALDSFAEGKIGLSPVNKRQHRIGLLLDKAIESDLRRRHLQVADACRATLGIDVAHCVVTNRNVGVSTCVSASGASWGNIEDTEALIEGAQALLDKGCTCIAVVVRFPEDEEDEDVNEQEAHVGDKQESEQQQQQDSLFDAYRKGGGVDAIAGAEALISHVITKKFLVPCAHAPAFAASEVYQDTFPKACAEEIGYTFLPCVLAYLNRAPMLIPLSPQEEADTVVAVSAHTLRANDVDVCVCPEGALGGACVLALLARGVLVIAVQENTSTMRCTGPDLITAAAAAAAAASSSSPSSSSSSSSSTRTREWGGQGIEVGGGGGRVVIARSYAEAAGIMAAHKAGILLESISSLVDPVHVTEL